MTTLKEEEPYAAVVDDYFLQRTCSKCFAWNLLGTERVHLKRCAGCQVLYYCGKKCQKGDWKDHKAECKLFHSADFVPSETARLIMRMIEKSRSQPDFKSFNGRTYDSLMDHVQTHRASFECMRTVKALHVEICRFMGPDAPDLETVLLANSKKAINCFSIFDGSPGVDSRGTGIYLGLSALDHSCRPDAFVMNQGSKLMLRTTNKDLVYSDKLTIDYSSGKFFQDTYMRRSHLFSSYVFVCYCKECQDLELDKKRTSGRPSCCPEGWFSVDDRRCSVCNQEVPIARATQARLSNERLRGVIFAAAKRSPAALLTVIPDLIDDFEVHKDHLSNENTYLISIADMIYGSSLQDDMEVAVKYLDLCVPLTRKCPHSLYRTLLLLRRHVFYDVMKYPPQDIKSTLNEALEGVEVVFGPNHELTQFLRQKKIIYAMGDLSVR